jgi:hypothetical protein
MSFKEVVMAIRRLIGWFTLIALFVLPFAPRPPVAQAQAEPTWERQAEQNFYLGPGMGRRLMTQEEWQEHWKKMQSMSPEERQKYRVEWHKKMVERARERGITMPETPGPRGPGAPGSGTGPGGGRGRGGQY